MGRNKLMTKDLKKTDSVVKPGQRLEFSVMNDDVEERTYSSRVEDIDENTLTVAMPYDEHRVPIIPRHGEQVFGKIIERSCAYRFVAIFKEPKSQPLPVWILQKPPVVERFQKREFVRVKVTRPIVVHPLDEEGSVQSMLTTNTVDISGGGVCFVVFSPLTVGNRVTMDIDNLPNMELMQVIGEAGRCQPVDVAGIKVYHVGVRFLAMDTAAQAKLVRFVFELQRRELKMGL